MPPIAKSKHSHQEYPKARCDNPKPNPEKMTAAFSPAKSTSLVKTIPLQRISSSVPLIIEKRMINRKKFGSPTFSFVKVMNGINAVRFMPIAIIKKVLTVTV